MSSNTINVDLNLRSNLRQGTTDAEGLNSQLSTATRNLIAYNRAAAIGGGTARDFSKEAEGLGGIVRSYAIIAANVYAVSAAFNVLSDAMDTSIMVKSMDTLGARSGIALGSLAKELVKVSDGALSLKDSLEVVSKGTTAGMTSTQLKDLTKVAGNASKALGLNMVDAMSRLIRGTSKLEPELLDELGIFTKIEPAVNEYARSLGKSAASLTDFEKRQAFLTATIKEGTEKYSELGSVGVNVYTKLSATLKDTLQASLEAINKLLIPVLEALSKNPTALYGVLVGIGALLLKQLIPALTQFSLGLERSANAASIAAVDRVNKIQKVIADRQTAASAQAIAASEAEAEARINSIDNVEKKLKSLQRRGGGITPGIKEIIDKDVRAIDLTEEKIKELRKEVKQSGMPTQDRRVQYAYIKSLEDSRAAELAHIDAVKTRETAILAAQKNSWTYRNEEILQNRAIQKSVEQLNLREVANNTRELGFIEARRKGLEDIRERRKGPVSREIPTGAFDPTTGEAITKTVTAPKLGAVAGGFQAIKVTAVAATAALSTFLAVASPWLTVLTLLAPALGALHDYFVGNIKDIEATNEAYDKLNSGIKAAYTTIDFLGKNSSRLLSVDNLTAAANALDSVGDSLVDFTKKAQTELASGSKWYGFVEGIQKAFGFGTEKSISKALMSSLDAAVKLTVNNSEPLRKELAGVLNLSADATFADIELAAKTADPDKQMKLAQALKQTGVNAKAAVQPTKDLLESLNQTAKVFDNIISSVLPSSGLAKWAYDGIVNMQSFRKEIGNAATDIGALNDIVAAPGELIKKFGIEGSAAIIPLIPEIKKLNKEYTETLNKLGDLDKVELSSFDKTIAKQKALVEVNKEAVKRSPTDINQKDLKVSEDQLNRYIAMREDKIAKSSARKDLLIDKTKQEGQIASIFAEFDKASAKSVIEFGKLFTAELGNSAAKARLEVNKTLTGYITDPGVKAKLELINTKEEVNLEKIKLTATYNLITAMENNRIELAKNTLAIKRRDINADEKMSKDEKTKALSDIAIEEASLNRRQVANMAKDAKAAFRQLEEEATPTKIMGRGGKPIEIQGSQAAQRALMETGPILLQKQAAGAAAGTLDATIKSAQVRANVEGVINDIYKKREETIEAEITSLKAGRTQAELLSTGELDRLNKVNDIDTQILEKENQKKIQQAERISVLADFLAYELRNDKERAGLAKDAATIAASNLEKAKNQTTEAERLAIQEKNRQNTLSRISASYSEIYEKQKNSALILDATRKLEDANTESLTSRFDAEVSLGKYTEQQIQDKRKQFSLNQVAVEGIRQQEDATKNLAAQQTKLGEELAKATLPGYTGTRTAEQIVAEMQAQSAAYGISIEAINKLTAAKKENIAITNSLSVQEKGFADIFTKGFESMADAMAEFVKTGKLDFKSLINSMIMDLIRFQLRSQMQELAGPGGGANFFAKLASSLFSSGPTYNTGGQNLPGSFNPENAKGGVYSPSGIEKFATGAAFTNSIVNSPTLFKFAQGTGLMGEAGPEAIMPLKRDSSGTLGVRGGNQGKVDIVVNNYSGQKAETKETTDSRGNRKIEVVVGEMTAGDISKPGSSSQQALRSNYGLQPALIRR